MSKALRLSVLFAAVATLPALAQSGASQLVTLRHASGQGVAPVYEGFDVNPDGSCNMWFGYMNRNYEEEIDLPVGPGNAFEPGPDRGQPTHFMPRRHKDFFSVTVPKDFGDQTLTWALTFHGQTQKVVGTLKPAANRRNPDPSMWVGFGERSVDDMLQVWVDVVYLDDAEFQRLVDERNAHLTLAGGVQHP